MLWRRSKEGSRNSLLKTEDKHIYLDKTSFHGLDLAWLGFGFRGFADLEVAQFVGQPCAVLLVAELSPVPVVLRTRFLSHK